MSAEAIPSSRGMPLSGGFHFACFKSELDRYYVGTYGYCQMKASRGQREQGCVAIDYISSAGAAAIGARLRRLSERIDREAHELHTAFGVPGFEQRWFGLLNQLDLAGPLSVGELATKLGISHVSVSQSRASLERAGHIHLVADPNDGRRRHLCLTPAGRALVARLRPLWVAMADAAVELDNDAGDILEPLRKLETALDAQSLFDRTRRHLASK